MKQLTSIIQVIKVSLFCSLFFPMFLMAQSPCTVGDCQCLLDKAELLKKQKTYIEALKKYYAAEICLEDKGKNSDVKARIIQLFKDIENLKIEAEENAAIARREAQRAKKAKREAIIEKQKAKAAQLEAERLAAIAEAEKRRAIASEKLADQRARYTLAHDLADKAARDLQEGKRTRAYRLAEFAYRYIYPSNYGKTILYNTHHYNDLPTTNHDTLIQNWHTNLLGHTKGIFTLAYSPSNHLMLTGGRDKIARLWDVQTKQIVGLLEGHTQTIFTADFSTDGSLVATGGNDKVIRIWDVYALLISLLFAWSVHPKVVRFYPFLP